MLLRTTLIVAVLVLTETAHAQSSDDLKSRLDQALKTIQDLQNRVNALEEQQRRAVPQASPRAAAQAPTPETRQEPAPPPPLTAASSPPSAAPPEAPAGAAVVAPNVVAEKGAKDENKARLEITGKIQLDAIYDFKRVNPQWNSTLRPSQIPVTCPGDAGCGKDGETIFSVRQSAIDFKGFVPTAIGELKTDLSFDLFGSGGGNTQIRLLNAWAELGKFGVGQYYSLFMNVDTFPNIIDYWGPSGMPFLRNPQVRYTPIDRSGMTVAFSLEAPNAAIDTGKVSEIDPSLGVQGRTQWPDLVANVRWHGEWGQFQTSAILRSVGYETTTTPNNNPSGAVTGWGLNLTGWLNTVGKDRVTGGLVYGHAIASYMNDGGVDVAPNASLQAQAVPSLGVFVYYDHYWSELFSTSLGYSMHHQENTAGQLGNAFRQGSYASANLLWYPVKNVLGGMELLWGKLQQFNSQSADDVRVQFTGQYKF